MNFVRLCPIAFLAAALALGGRQALRSAQVMVIDAKDPRNFADSAFDGRASAITASSRLTAPFWRIRSVTGTSGRPRSWNVFLNVFPAKVFIKGPGHSCFRSTPCFSYMRGRMISTERRWLFCFPTSSGTC